MSLLSKLGNLIWYGALAYVGLTLFIIFSGMFGPPSPIRTVLPIFYFDGLVLAAAGVFKLALGGRRRAD